MPSWADRSECRLTLTRNCRNTVQIARISNRAVLGCVTQENYEKLPADALSEWEAAVKEYFEMVKGKPQ